MSAFADLLDGPRARGAFLLRSILEPPWSLRIEDRAPLTLVAAVRGEAWIVPGDAGEERLRPGDVAVVRGPDPYIVADDPATPPRAVVRSGGCATTPEGEDLCDALDLGVRTWGGSPDGATTLLTGTYRMRSEVDRRLLATLPRLLVLPSGSWDSPLVPLLHEEIARDAPGQEAVLDRLLDLLLVAVLRTWFSRPGAEAPGWYRAHGDPVVGPALRLLHEHPAHPWTVAGLAARTGTSRAALARRFTELVGEPPMTYLTNRRLALAADLLRDPGATVEAVAGQVGYGSPFALSTAFKRAYGVSPRDHRSALSAPGQG
ncbi:AraC family transcriptional regulator [Planomonospora parontospora]|uniref:AraC family transcriptional regulator n=1 Tax=Planomonospora parontospora TaxID=58119 RepID=UPI0016710C3B|nr:AraC family transcriptional regulator [Planomonospora parontospora]GGL16399.1 AraC family transcriptional regulator [Planomonospora parontospora subsp. antibiotica]GII15370.1 AraC family transcriptional regulator [Planomonospora parontospora subsp. antibiotica]